MLGVEAFQGLRKRHRQVIDTLKKHCLDDDAMELLQVEGPQDPNSPRAALAYMERCLKRSRPSYKAGTPIYRFYRPAFEDFTSLPDSLLDLVLDYRFIRLPWSVDIDYDTRKHPEDESDYDDYAFISYNHTPQQQLKVSGQLEIYSQADFNDNLLIQTAFSKIKPADAQYAYLIQPLISAKMSSSQKVNYCLRVSLNIERTPDDDDDEFNLIVYADTDGCLEDRYFDNSVATNREQCCGFLYTAKRHINAIVIFFTDNDFLHPPPPSSI
jgi:hypothetical protein